MNLNKKPLLAATAFTAAFLGIMIFAVAPLVSSIKNAGIEIYRQQEKIAAGERRILGAREFNAFARREKGNLDKLGQVFVDSKMPLDLIHSLETAARDAGAEVKFSSSSQSRRDKSGGWPAVSYEMDVFGPAPAILRFIDKIETSPYLITVRSIEIVSEQGAGLAGLQAGPGDASAHILIEVYAKQQ